MRNKIKKYLTILLLVIAFPALDFANTTNTIFLQGIDIKQKVLNEYLDAISWRSDEILDKKSIIVRYNPGTSLLDINNFENKYNLLNKSKLIDDIDLCNYELPNDIEISLELLTSLNKFSFIMYVEPDYNCTLNDDSYFNMPWSLKNKAYTGIDINIESAWDITKGNSSVIVAIIDSGIDYNHTDLKNNIWVNVKEIPNNGIDDDNDGYIDDTIGWNFFADNNNPMDDYGHGTHVSGIIAASENNQGVVGIAPNVKLMPIKVFGANGYISNFSGIISAIVYAHNHGASIVNISFGGKGNSQSLYDVMSKYSDMLFVSAAGNNASNDDIITFYPAGYDLVNNISVASIDENGVLSSFSNYGIKTVDVAAPGKSIYSTLPNNMYGYMSGTSIAAPHVAGIAALIKSCNMSLNADVIKQTIMDTVRHFSLLQDKIKTGGLIDAGKAISSIETNNSNSLKIPIIEKIKAFFRTMF